ncbi:MAG: DUF4382 domain-containing protein [Fusobacteriota bacterium]
MNSKKVIMTILITLSFIFVVGCFGESDSDDETSTGTISLSLTDAPIADAAGVEGVYITIDSIEYELNGKWVTSDGFEGPQTFNLLELTGGNVAPLGDTTIEAGEVSQIRFMLSSETATTVAGINTGSYIAMDPDGEADGDSSDDVNFELFVPSGDQTGYKANGPFTVPSNGTVEITADFDVRKSVVYRGKPYTTISAIDVDKFLLKPTIRLIVNNQAGSIAGNFTAETTTDSAFTIFAYEDGTYDNTEATAADDTSSPFPNAVSSSNVNLEEGTYELPFLTAGTYDLVVAEVDTSGDYAVVSTTYSGIEVNAETETTQDIEIE